MANDGRPGGLVDKLLEEIRGVLDDIPVDFGGGCSVSKAYLMAWLICRYRMKNTLDIGVYRGRSLLPQAVAHRLFTGGRVYGVDPWDAMEEEPAVDKATLDAFIARTDFQSLHEGLVAASRRHRLEESIRLRRMTSSAVAEEFRREGVRFDLVHIDGNHDSGKVMEGVRRYLPLLESRAFIVMDDVSWASVKPARSEVEKAACLVFKRADAENDYAVYVKGDGVARRLYLRAAPWCIGRG